MRLFKTRAPATTPNIEAVPDQGEGLVYLRCHDCRDLVGCPGALVAMDDERQVMALHVDLTPMVAHAAADLPRHPHIES